MCLRLLCFLFFFSSRRRHTRCSRDWSSDVCSSDLGANRLASTSLLEGLTWGYYAAHSILAKLTAASSSASPSVQRAFSRSEERRVGKECRSRWPPSQ